MDLKDAGIILFDGTCILCHNFYQWCVRHNTNSELVFGLIQETKNWVPEQISSQDSIIYFEDVCYFTKSSAVIRILKRMGGFWRILGSIGNCVPKVMRDWVYNLVARNRYSWFGQQDTCSMVGIPSEQNLMHRPDLQELLKSSLKIRSSSNK